MNDLSRQVLYYFSFAVYVQFRNQVLFKKLSGIELILVTVFYPYPVYCKIYPKHSSFKTIIVIRFFVSARIATDCLLKCTCKCVAVFKVIIQRDIQQAAIAGFNFERC